MLKLNALLTDNRFNTISRIIDLYPEYDFESGERYTVVVLENEKGQSVGIAENIVNEKYTILPDTKENKIKALQMDFKAFQTKWNNTEVAAQKALQETGEHHYHDTFKQMEYWEDELLESAEYLGIQLY